jgi:hypothetical protein
MAQRQAVAYQFDTGTGTKQVLQELLPFDLSRADQLVATLTVEEAGANSSDLLEVFIESRGRDGSWDERFYFSQVQGDATVSVSAPHSEILTLQQFGTLSDAEEAHQTTGSGGAGLTPGSVRNGAFPRPAYDPAVGARVTAWRIRIEQTDANSDGGFAGVVRLAANTQT